MGGMVMAKFVSGGIGSGFQMHYTTNGEARAMRRAWAWSSRKKNAEAAGGPLQLNNHALMIPPGERRIFAVEVQGTLPNDATCLLSLFPHLQFAGKRRFEYDICARHGSVETLLRVKLSLSLALELQAAEPRN